MTHIQQLLYNFQNIDEKRAFLKQLSADAKKIQNLSPEEITINEIIIKEFYKDKNNTIFKTLKEWRKEGYKVLKGSKAFILWAKPLAKKEEEKEDEENEGDFYPIAHVFSNAQVVKHGEE